MGSRRTLTLSLIVLIVMVCSVAGGRLEAADREAPAAKVEGAPRMQGVAYRFFDDRTGALTGQLRIGHVDMEYQRKGFLRVAWKPQVILQDVKFEVSSDMAWPVQGAQMVRALLALGGRDELVFRDVRVQLAGTPGREITAPNARLLPDGALEMSGATLAEEGRAQTDNRTGTFRLALTGQHAGQLRQMVAQSRTASPRLSFND
jgi:hypothetical protein